MLLADTFQIANEEKLSFAVLAVQAEYGDPIGNEQLQSNFLVEHYASNDLINEVGENDLEMKLFCMIRVLVWYSNSSAGNYRKTTILYGIK
jgi:hypothetical protein